MKILQAILLIAFTFCLLNEQWKIAVILGIANMIFWLVPEWYQKHFKN